MSRMRALRGGLQTPLIVVGNGSSGSVNEQNYQWLGQRLVALDEFLNYKKISVNFMDIVLLFNGLGNQLSQYAFFIKKRQLGQQVAAFYAFGGHNGYELERLFGIKQKLSLKVRCLRMIFRIGSSRRLWPKPLADAVLSLFRIRIVYEKNDYRFEESLLKPWFGIRFMVGGWHDAKYFEGAEDVIRKTYHFPELDPINQSLLQQITKTHSVSLHIRRGDYLSADNRRLFGNIATFDYYRNALAVVNRDAQAKGYSPRFFVFSDDVAWCREHLDLPNAEFVNLNSGHNSWKDLVLMSHCRVNILANSTFSWWAAWLNTNNSKKVICPTRFVSANSPGENIYHRDWQQVAG